MSEADKPTLKAIQTAFEQSVFHGEEDVNQWINADERGDAAKRMNIYRYAYRARLMDVLFIDYPTIHEILGDEMFAELCQAYLAAYPSTSFSVRWFGRNMPAFLRDAPPYAEHAYLAEMADFEWQKGECFDGEDSPVIGLDALSMMSPDAFTTLQFEFVPTLRQMTCEYDTPTLWKTINQDKDADLPMPTKLDTPIAWALWRKGLAPTWQSLDVDHAWAMQSAMQGASFVELCEGLREWIDDEHIPARAASFVQTWLREEMISTLKY